MTREAEAQEVLDYLRKYYTINEGCGRFIKNDVSINGSKSKPGERLGSYDKRKFTRRATILGKKYTEQELVFLWYGGGLPDETRRIANINGNFLQNAISNLMSVPRDTVLPGEEEFFRDLEFDAIYRGYSIKDAGHCYHDCMIRFIDEPDLMTCPIEEFFERTGATEEDKERYWKSKKEREAREKELAYIEELLKREDI